MWGDRRWKGRTHESVRNSWAFTICLLGILSALGSASSSCDGDDGAGIEMPTTTLSPMGPFRGSDFEAFPEASVPGGLGRLALPRTSDGVRALFETIRDTLAVEAILSTGPAFAELRWGSDQEFRLQSFDVSTGNFWPEGWKTEQILIEWAKGHDCVVLRFGREGQVGWVESTDKWRSEVTGEEGVLHVLLWGERDSSWVFMVDVKDEDVMVAVSAIKAGFSFR